MTMNLFCFSSQMTAAFSLAQRAVAVFYMALFKFYRSRDELVRNKKRPGKPGSRCFRAARCKYVPFGAKRHQVPPRGVKLRCSPSGNKPVLKQGSAKCSAPSEVDLQLVALIQAWLTLSKAVQQQIMLLVG